jgi:hypothetical protein
MTHILETCSIFGCTEERRWPCLIRMNKKGGMTDKEFEKYINNSIAPLYPNLEDTKCVLLKVDSGPGCNRRELLMKCQFCGLYIYPGLPYATSVQQVTDHNYGPFKSVVRNNLKKYLWPSTLPVYQYTSQHFNVWANCLQQYHPGRHVGHHLPTCPCRDV